MARRVLVCFVLLAVLIGATCAGPLVAQPGPPTLYTVTATVMQTPGQAPHACFAMPLPYPPIGCGGPDLRAFGLLTMGGITRYRNGVLATGMLRLVGTWDGQALTLTRPPESRTASEATRMPGCAQEPGQAASDPIPPVMKQVMADDALLRSHRIQLLEFYPCKNTVFLGLAVADSRSVAFLTNRYGHVEVAGWLQPVT